MIEFESVDNMYIQVGYVAVFSDICFLEDGGSVFLADLVASFTFTWIQQQNQVQHQEQYIRQHFYPFPIYHFLLPFSSTPPLYPIVRYAIVCARTQQEVKQSGTSIHKQAPAFY